MNTEIQALREEIAKLRERIAVLEAKQTPVHQQPWWMPSTTPAVPFPAQPYIVTC